jgi:hypothetical protein
MEEDINDILIIDRLKELKDIQCGNRLDTLRDNKCYNGDQDPYTAQCPINYEMYKLDNKYTCYKNCDNNMKPGNIDNIDYTINRNGKQCILDPTLQTLPNTSKLTAYNRDVMNIHCYDDDIQITTNGNLKCLKYIKTLDLPDDIHNDECPVGSVKLANENKCVGNVYDGICETNYEKIDNKCYKLCKDNYITANINKLDNFQTIKNGNKCINDLLTTTIPNLSIRT